MRQLLGKHFVIFLTIFLVKTSRSQSLDQESLQEIEDRKNADVTRFEECMREDDNITLWCDKSNYDTISDITTGADNKDETVAEIASDIQILMINDSCLQALNPGDLSIFDHLTSFMAENNFLTILKTGTFSDNSDLKSIDLSRNKIKRIEEGAFKGLIRLLRLDIGYNLVDEISRDTFKDLSSLKYLSLERNQIQIIPIRAFIASTKLTILILKGNRISQIHKYGLDELSKLTELDLSDNKIQEIKLKTFHSLTQLRKLNLRGNQLTTYPHELRLYAINLEILDLGSNLLRNFENGTFSALKKLRMLKLDQNSLTRIGDACFHGNENLELLNISVNALKDISAKAFQSNRNLSTLLLQSNHLQTPKIEWFEHFQTLPDGKGRINLSDNEWWCDCTTKSFENFMTGARKENPVFSEQLDIYCSSNKEYIGKLSGLDIFCPVDGASPTTKSKPHIPTATLPKLTLSTKSVLIGMLFDLPMTTNISDDVVEEKSSVTSLHDTPTVPTTRLSTTGTSKSPGPILIPLYSASSASSAITLEGVMVVTLVLIILVMIIGAFVCLKRSKRHGLRNVWRRRKRDRHSSRQPFLNDNNVSVCERELPEPFSGSDDEDIIFSMTSTHVQDKAKQYDTFLTVDEDTFYTPRTTPRQTPKLGKHGDDDQRT